jgi:hypothetical protein
MEGNKRMNDKERKRERERERERENGFWKKRKEERKSWATSDSFAAINNTGHSMDAIKERTSSSDKMVAEVPVNAGS